MRLTCSRKRTRRGFTLMEVLLVLVILVILGSLVGVGVNTARRRSFNDAAKAQIKMFEKALQFYEMDLYNYPSASQGLQALLQPPTGLANESKWRGPYLESISVLPLDPWDTPYQYQPSDSGAKISSAGADGVHGTEDDVSNQ